MIVLMCKVPEKVVSDLSCLVRSQSGYHKNLKGFKIGEGSIPK